MDRWFPKNLWGENPAENYFRHKVMLRMCPAQAFLRIYVDTGYELFVNGRLVAAVDEWANTRDYAVAVFLRKGDNCIAVRAMNHSGHRGFALELVCDGNSVLRTDGNWKTFPEERWGWMLPDYDDSTWQPPQILDLRCAGFPQWSTLPGSEPDRIIPALEGSPFFTGNIPKGIASPFYSAAATTWTPAPEVVAVAGKAYLQFTDATPSVVAYPVEVKLHAVNSGCSIEPIPHGFRVSAPTRYEGAAIMVDFGEEVCGYFRLRLRSEQPFSLRLHYGETLDEAASEPSRDVLQHRMLTEKFRIAAGTQEFESRMRVGLRYIRVECYDGAAPVEITAWSLRGVYYPVAGRGYFHSSDEQLNRLWEASRKTVHLCMQEYYVDAIKRDRFCWVGDTRLEALFNYYLFADTALFEYCWDRIGAMQYPDGAIPSAYGEGLSQLWDYTADYLIAFAEYYRHTGKAEFLIKHREHIYRAMDYLLTYCNADGLPVLPPNPLGKLWMVTLNNSSGIDAYAGILFEQSLRSVAQAARLAGDAERESRYRNLLAQVAPLIQKLVADQPLETTAANQSHVIIQYEIARRYFADGQAQTGLDFLRRRYGMLLDNRSDTLAEGFYDGIQTPIDETHPQESPTFISYCHGWTAAAAALLASGVAGIIPLEPGFARVRIVPQPCDLTEFTAVVPTPCGEIALHYTETEIDIFIPVGITAELCPPYPVDDCVLPRSAGGENDILPSGTRICFKRRFSLPKHQQDFRHRCDRLCQEHI